MVAASEQTARVVHNMTTPDSRELGERLRDRREASLKWSNPIRQVDVADAIGMSQGTVWKLETGRADFSRLSGEQTRALLEAYGYTRDEALAIVRRYHLNWPLPPVTQREDFAERVQYLPYKGDVGDGGREESERIVPKELIGDHAGRDLAIWRVGEATMATSEAWAITRIGSQLIVADPESVRPREGSLVLCCTEHGDGPTEFLAVYRSPGPDRAVFWSGTGWLLPASPDQGGGPEPRRIDGKDDVRVVGIVVGQYMKMG